MNRDIISIVENYPMLHFKVNKGERYRIMRSGIRRGSLWVAPRIKGYSITPTGEVAAQMHDFLCSHFGKEAGEDYLGRWKWWNIENIVDLSKIIRRYASIEVPNNTLQSQEVMKEPSD